MTILRDHPAGCALAGSALLHGLGAMALMLQPVAGLGRAGATDAGSEPAISVNLVSASRLYGVAPQSVAAAQPATASALPDPDAASVASLARAAPPSGSVAEPLAVGPAVVADRAVIDPMLGDAYRRRLLAHIAPFKRYPAQAEAIRGVVQLVFMIDASGKVTNVWVKSSSGFASLDDEAVATVWRAQPMPPVPQGLPAPLAIQLPVSFDQS